MLKHIPPILTPELLKVLMEMGHGDEIVIADGNFPGAAIAQRLIRLDGHGVPEILDAVMRFLPLDSYTEKPVGLMAVVPGDPVKPTIWEDYRCILDKHEPKRPEIEYMERFAFYERPHLVSVKRSIRRERPEAVLFERSEFLPFS